MDKEADFSSKATKGNEVPLPDRFFTERSSSLLLDKEADILTPDDDASNLKKIHPHKSKL